MKFPAGWLVLKGSSREEKVPFLQEGHMNKMRTPVPAYTCRSRAWGGGGVWCCHTATRFSASSSWG